MRIVVWWIRRVIRLQDNPVLQAALKKGIPVMPVYIYNHQLLAPRNARTTFLLQAIEGLQLELQDYGAHLFTYVGTPEDVFSALSNEIEIDTVFSEAEVTLFGKTLEDAVAEVVPLKRIQAITVLPSEAVTKPDGTAYRKYTAYRNAWLKIALPQASKYDLSGKFLSDISFILPFPVKPVDEQPIRPYTSHMAQIVLNQYLDGAVKEYAVLRDRIDLDETSHCSHLFRFGLLSPREAVDKAQHLLKDSRDELSNKGYQAWINELIWREFFTHLMDSYQTQDERLANKDGSVVAWRDSPDELKAWQEGMTGYPLVDAAMRQLQQTGWMPNRVRMVVASFLVKDLFLWWGYGERWFMRYLLDGDPSANHGNWQWAAGIGTDAAPFFRVFNPITQSKKFDPNASYIRTWLPELEKVQDKFVHEPWTMNLQEQKFTNCIIGKDYPAPMVDHTAARLRALDLFKQRQRRGTND
jgi:deoxyribodipyrimidine photo-lyase